MDDHVSQNVVTCEARWLRDGMCALIPSLDFNNRDIKAPSVFIPIKRVDTMMLNKTVTVYFRGWHNPITLNFRQLVFHQPNAPRTPPRLLETPGA